jgi:hypothetical protein
MAAACACTLALDAASVPVPEPAAVLSSLRHGHPRLMLDDAGLERLKQTIKVDPTAARYFADVIRQADAYCNEPLLAYTVAEERRLLEVSRRCIERMYALGLAWRITGERRYVEKAEKDLLAVCAFENWTPSLAIIYPQQAKHREYEKKNGVPPYSFLDVSEMCHGVGLGYDWFYHALSPPTRAAIKAALVTKGLTLGVSAYQGGGTTKGMNDSWTTYNHNWNLVCNGGLVVGALALAETDPEIAQVVIPGAVKSMPLALETYGPDGAWPEGPGYWDYATSYAVFGLAAMESALGTDFGLGQIPGFAQTGNFPLLTTGPTGLYLNFADSRERNARGRLPSLFWLGRHFRNSFFPDQEHALLRGARAHPLHLIWYSPPSSTPPSALERDYRFRGPTEVAVFRSGWDADALYVGVKAGDNGFNHAHLDLGTFELDALGVRWARDLGSDNYALPGYFDFHYLTQKRGGERWKYFRNASLSHNIPLLDGEDQDELATAKILAYRSTPAAGHVRIDLAKAYERKATRVERGLAIVDQRRALLVQDEFELKGPTELVWNMLTDADVTLDGRRAVMRQNGKTMTAEVLEPAGAVFSTISAEQAPPQKLNKGSKRLMVKVPAAKGAVRIAVLLAPHWPNGTPSKNIRVLPLSTWAADGP